MEASYRAVQLVSSGTSFVWPSYWLGPFADGIL